MKKSPIIRWGIKVCVLFKIAVFFFTVLAAICLLSLIHIFHYISPEQTRGGYCDERSDIYSFGITMYEMVTGRVPFEGDNTVAVALAHLETPITPPSQLNPVVSSGLEQIILKCTQKKPDRRYSSIGDVLSLIHIWTFCYLQ